MAFYRRYRKPAKGMKKVARKGVRKVAKKTQPRTFRQKVLSVINRVSEKKKVTYQNVSPQGVSQVYGNTDGWNCLELTPQPAQGTANNQRLGSEISLTSINLRMQFYQQSATVGPIRLRYHLVWVKGGDQSITVSQFMNEFLSVDPFSVHRDYNSSRNIDYMSAFRVLRSGRCILGQDSATSQTMIKDVRLGCKFAKPLTIRFNGNLTTVAQGKVFLVVLADSGNYSTTTANTETNIPVQAINTGALFNYFIELYYTDM